MRILFSSATAVNAPNYKWNDYKGSPADYRGKVLMILVNDPRRRTRNHNCSGGKGLTYYGRWTYKYEEAARRGAGRRYSRPHH
jgi:hypothetical protein